MPQRLHDARISVAHRRKVAAGFGAIAVPERYGGLGLTRAHDAAFKELEAQGITGAQAAKVLKPLDTELAKYRFAPIRVIEPEREFSETLEFDTAKIRTAIQAGRDSVNQAWEALEPFLT